VAGHRFFPAPGGKRVAREVDPSQVLVAPKGRAEVLGKCFEMATAAQAAKHVFLSTGRFRDLVGAGVITRMPSDQYEFDVVRREYILNAQKIMAGRGADSGAALSTQRAKLAAAQASAAEFRNAQSQGSFVELTLMQRMLEQAFGVVREVALGLPGKVSDSLTPHCAEDREAIHSIIRDEVYEMLNGLSSPRSMAAQAASEPSKRK
jgi:phage terminase Nu1 subunit (DNA packaging protein)